MRTITALCLAAGLILVTGIVLAAEPISAGQAGDFAVRGTLPWHNFLSGPSAWNEEDYRA